MTRNESAIALSIVIVSSDSAAATLRTIARFVSRDDVEIVIVSRRGLINRKTFRDQSRIKIIEIDGRAGIARMRGLGFAAACGPIVAFCEDSCRLDRDWAEAWIEAFRADDSALAATGRVACDLDATSLLGRSIFYCEYAIFMNDRSDLDRSARLAGNNFAVRRGAAVAVCGDELHETELDRLWPNGRIFVPKACVYYNNNDSWMKAIRDRWIAGLDFGGLRRARGIARILAFGSSGAIWGIQAWRVTRCAIASAVVQARPHRFAAIVSFVAVAPIVYLLLFVYSLGECAGRCGLMDRRRLMNRKGIFGGGGFIDRLGGFGSRANDVKQRSEGERQGSPGAAFERDLIEPSEQAFDAAEAGDLAFGRSRG